ncbi:MAG: acyl carrier protein [Mizugakiibacter sp.]|uniref:acyl carrier protein n=1 Tax=Mizugakiibacter sp. TaxID=1972610 RepID=UPI0031C42E54|nr:acyl carrier protein [Xanthomonadaceae bacterium]
MSARDAIEVARTALLAVAPDLAGERIAPDAPFRDQFDFDSMDFMHFVAGLAKATGIDIPERDYPRLQSLADCARYLHERGWR